MKQVFFGVVLGVLATIGFMSFRTPKMNLIIHNSKGVKLYKVHICWASPSKEALKKCQEAGTCSGVGTYAWHPKKIRAEEMAVRRCDKEYGKNTCNLEYCEKGRKP